MSCIFVVKMEGCRHSLSCTDLELLFVKVGGLDSAFFTNIDSFGDIPVLDEILENDIRDAWNNPSTMNTDLMDVEKLMPWAQINKKEKSRNDVDVCMTTTSIHLDVLSDMTTDSFINALRRFLARRGPVRNFYTDNGSNFMEAERVLPEEIKTWNQGEIQEYLRQHNNT